VVGSKVDDVDLSGSASMRITDYGTLRARAGFQVGNFLPFAMIGMAVGRADLARSATVTVVQTPVAGGASATVNYSEGDAKNGAFLFGWALGGGVEVMVMPKVFLRAEYELISFNPIWGISAQIQTGRVGLGFKF
jgi:outer membrane immunogenic protein